MKFATDPTLGALTEAGEFPFARHADEPAGVQQLRERAWSALQTGGFDVRGREEWKYTDLTAVVNGKYRVGAAAESRVKHEFTSVHDEAIRLVFINGVLNAELSSMDDLPGGLVLHSLAGEAGGVDLGSIADPVDAPLTALNTAAWTDGMRLVVPAGVHLARPIELYMRVDATASERLVAPRHWICLEEGATATVIEFYDGTDDAASLVAPVTEVDCAADAVLHHWKVMRENTSTRHYGSTHVRQAANSRYESREFAFGGANVRREVHVDLAGEGAHCDVNSLVMAAGNERMDNRTRIDHRVPNCTTDELYKGIYAGKSRGIFDGLIHVHRDAQQTAAFQTNRNLLLSDDSRVSSIPRLEIYADDVKCSHGSTTGQLDDDQVFFLRSRGFAADHARVMLAQAFGSEVVEGVNSSRLREILNREIATRLAGLGVFR